MDSLAIIVIVLSLAALGLLMVLVVSHWRHAREQEQLASRLGSIPGETLEDSITRLSREAEAAAGISELRDSFDQLIVNCPLPLLILDESLTIVDLSHRAELELDQPRKRRGLLEGLESNELEDAARQAIATLEPAEIVVRLYAAGRRAYIAKLLPYKSGEKGMCLLFLQSAAATIEFGELRSQFAATVSHELRTPLAGIRAMVETLKHPDIEPEDRDRFLERIDRETNRLTQLVDDILFLSSLESGAANLDGNSDLRPIIDSIIEKLQAQAEKFEVLIKNRVPGGLAIPLPERMASTVFANLLENAIKYSGRGSHVEITGLREEGWIKILVKDDGIGIDAEHLPHIFERFYRVDKSRSRRLGGTGLGLSIVKHVVESASGEVKANSREGFGTELVVMLPARN
ncbi:MAG: sensor histidine kinase [Thermoleophilia bacterium]